VKMFSDRRETRPRIGVGMSDTRLRKFLRPPTPIRGRVLSNWLKSVRRYSKNGSFFWKMSLLLGTLVDTFPNYRNLQNVSFLSFSENIKGAFTDGVLFFRVEIGKICLRSGVVNQKRSTTPGRCRSYFLTTFRS
jgi:hypothetical protein